MKSVIQSVLVLGLLATVMVLSKHMSQQSEAPGEASQSSTVNAVLGDESFVAEMGRTPRATDDYDARITIHLAYVKQMLEASEPQGLTESQLEKRKQVLGYLSDYIVHGRYPKNTEKSYATPRFIDHEGTICAVGYMVEQTWGRAAAEAINTDHEYGYVLAMNDQRVEEWVNEHGLSLTEAAMIQPLYAGFRKIDHDATKAGKAATFAAIGINSGLAVASVLRFARRSNKPKTTAWIGLGLGATQLAAGLSARRDDGEVMFGSGQFSRSATWHTYDGTNRYARANIISGVVVSMVSFTHLILPSRQSGDSQLTMSMVPAGTGAMVMGRLSF